jgi:ketosteroid isomerase-like protein
MVGVTGSSDNTAEARELIAEELAATEDLDRRFMEAYNRLDVEVFMACLWNSPNLVVDCDGTKYLGWELVRQVTVGTFAGLQSAHVEIVEVTHMHSGDIVVAVGSAKYHLHSKDGLLKNFTVRWGDFRRKVDGQWVYVHQYAKTLAPPKS